MDKRIIRTKQNLMHAFLILGQEKHYTKITVTELAVAAGINRKTFYMYYSGIDDYIDCLERELIDKCRDILTPRDLSLNSEALLFFSDVRDLVRDNYSLYQILKKQNLMPSLQEKAKTMILESLQGKLELKKMVTTPKLALYADYIASGLLGMLSLWISYPDMSVEEFTETAALITLGGLRAVSAEENHIFP